MRFRFDEYILDDERFALFQDDVEIHVEPKVIELLIFMIENRGRLITKEEINHKIWGGRTVSDSALSRTIKIARQTLGDNGTKQQYIRTIHKKGFSFIGTVKEESCEGAKSEPTEGTKENFNSIHYITNQEPEFDTYDPRPTVAVIAFANTGNNPEQDFFANGITEDIITTLSKISKLILVTYSPRSSSKAVDIKEIGHQLKVDYMLEGSVRSDGNRLRISAHLIDVSSGHHIWAERYDRENKDLFALQDEVTKEVVSALQVELTEGDQALLASRGTDSIEAWKLTFEGEASVLEHRKDSVRRGRHQLQKALQIDPNYALAWNALATAHLKESLNKGWSSSIESSLGKALQASDRAMALDPLNPTTLASRSILLLSFKRFDEAKELAEKALLLANSAANTIAIAAITLRVCCEPEKSINHTLKAMRLCPIYPAWYPYGNAVCYWMLKQYDQAISAANEAIRIDAEFIYTHFVLAMIYAERGEDRKVKQAVDNVVKIDPNFSRQAYTTGLPFRDDVINARRELALIKAGMPD